MKLPRRKFLHLAAGAAALPGISRMASAQAYPARPVTIRFRSLSAAIDDHRCESAPPITPPMMPPMIAGPGSTGA
jgi:hypothetical protein